MIMSLDRPVPEPYLPLAACVRGRVYRLRSRHLAIGVFDGTDGFVGLREKGRWRLDREFHWDTGARFGTAKPTEEVAILPEEIEIVEVLGTRDGRSGRAVEFEDAATGGRGWYYFDTGEADPEIEPVAIRNDRLFAWLMDLEVALGLRRAAQG